MKVSYNWLKDYVQTDLPVEKVAEILTDTGLEVEGVEKIEQVEGGLEGLVVGKVLEKEKHPDADRLNVTRVDAGTDEPLQIVCGAPNVEAGQKVLVATVGTTLYPKGHDPFKIKKSKIRGVESLGMLCAEDEVGLGEGHDGILVLDPEAEIGQEASTYFNLEEDYTIEIGLTPNRADAMGHIGVARDLAAALYKEKKGIQWPSVDAFTPGSEKLSIDVQDAEGCPKYLGVKIAGVSVQPSPEWLQQRLRAIGLNPINNVVDITNYVLHETGQPLHAFDAQVVQDELVIRRAKQGEVFVTLDEVERKLHEDDLMICNTKDAMCIAGVFGGIHSGVSGETTDVVLESAYFDPVSIRKTAKRHGLNTDASFRFERGVDPNLTEYALKRAALLMQELAGGQVVSEVTAVGQETFAHFDVDVDLERCFTLLGKRLEEQEVTDILEALEIEIVKRDGAAWQLKVPPYRVDVKREADVYEEILRIYGFNNIPSPQKLNTSIVQQKGIDKDEFEGRVAEHLVSNGFNEMMSNSLTASRYGALEAFSWKEETLVKMLNPLSNELDVLRQSLLVNGLEAIAYNQNRQQLDLRLFEFGKTYFKTPEGYREEQKLMVYMVGRKQPEQWNHTTGSVDFYALKGAVMQILQRLGLDKNLKTEDLQDGAFEDGFQWSALKRKVAKVGWIKQDLLKAFDIKQPVYAAVLDWDMLLSMVHMNKMQFKALPKVPAVRRDLSLLLDQGVTFDQIRKLAFGVDRKVLKDVGLFDVYEGKNLEKGKKSYAVNFILHDEEKTLQDVQIDKIMSKIQRTLEEQIGAKLR